MKFTVIFIPSGLILCGEILSLLKMVSPLMNEKNNSFILSAVIS